MKIVVFFAEAEADLGKIWDYTAEKWGIKQAESYIDAIQDTCDGLARGTKYGRPVEVLPKFQKCLCGSHIVYFLDYADRIEVVRILHARQDVERHL